MSAVTVPQPGEALDVEVAGWPGTHAEYVLVLLVGRGLGKSRAEAPLRSQILLPSRWKGKVGQTGDLGEWSGGTTGGEVDSEVMVGLAGEPGGLGGPCGQGPAWPRTAAAPATGSVWKERERPELGG